MDLSAVQADSAQLEQLHILRYAENLNKQVGQLAEKTYQMALGQPIANGPREVDKPSGRQSNKISLIAPVAKTPVNCYVQLTSGVLSVGVSPRATGGLVDGPRHRGGECH